MLGYRSEVPILLHQGQIDVKVSESHLEEPVERVLEVGIADDLLDACDVYLSRGLERLLQGNHTLVRIGNR